MHNGIFEACPHRMNEQLKAKVAASNQAQANAEYAGIACKD